MNSSTKHSAVVCCLCDEQLGFNVRGGDHPLLGMYISWVSCADVYCPIVFDEKDLLLLMMLRIVQSGSFLYTVDVSICSAAWLWCY